MNINCICYRYNVFVLIVSSMSVSRNTASTNSAPRTAVQQRHARGVRGVGSVAYSGAVCCERERERLWVFFFFVLIFLHWLGLGSCCGLEWITRRRARRERERRKCAAALHRPTSFSVRSSANLIATLEARPDSFRLR